MAFHAEEKEWPRRFHTRDNSADLFQSASFLDCSFHNLLAGKKCRETKTTKGEKDPGKEGRSAREPDFIPGRFIPCSFLGPVHRVYVFHIQMKPEAARVEKLKWIAAWLLSM